jgi:hypothetical protein
MDERIIAEVQIVRRGADAHLRMRLDGRWDGEFPLTDDALARVQGEFFRIMLRERRIPAVDGNHFSPRETKPRK